jgi:sporulation protein YlmC with PRC-barrel domain
MERTPQEITSLVGREVYSNNGVYVGEVEDVRLNIDDQVVTGLAVSEINHELFEGVVAGARGVMLPYRWVMSVGDVVLVTDLVERVADPDPEPEAEEETAVA